MLAASEGLGFKGRRIISQMNEDDCPEQLRDVSEEAVRTR